MEIKKNRQLKLGDTIKYSLALSDDVSAYSSTTKPKPKKYDLICIGVYPHHVLFKMLKPPYHKVDIQNVDLWRKGIYTHEDILHKFATRGTFGT